MPSQWGSVHIFDLCLWFGHIDTALALALHGVEGCRLKLYHLGALTLPDASDAPPPGYGVGDVSDSDSDPGWCDCEGWQTCSGCCFGFDLDNGIWMKDWDAHLKHAARAARKETKTPLISGILEIFSKLEVLPLAMSDEAAARLLEIAILCGNTKAAANLAQTSAARPLRRWRGEELSRREDLPMLSAALLAGADFQDLHSGDADIPLLLEMALDFNSEDWQQLGHLFSSTPRWPSRDAQVGNAFLSREIREDGRYHYWISTRKVRNALRSGWDLKYVCTGLDVNCREYTASLLDLAILCGNSDSADALATAGVQLGEERPKYLKLLKQASRGESLALHPSGLQQGSAFECKSAAFAAACASLRSCFNAEGAEKGIALYQVLTKKFHPRGVPMALVHDILAFSMEAPKILDQLDLWDELRGWMLPLEVKAGGADRGLEKDLEVEELSGLAVAEELGPLGLCPEYVFLLAISPCYVFLYKIDIDR